MLLHHNFVVFAPMIMKFGIVMKLYVFYIVIADKIVMSLLLRNYDVITFIFAEK